jgi:hypothetical protein
MKKTRRIRRKIKRTSRKGGWRWIGQPRTVKQLINDYDRHDCVNIPVKDYSSLNHFDFINKAEKIDTCNSIEKKIGENNRLLDVSDEIYLDYINNKANNRCKNDKICNKKIKNKNIEEQRKLRESHKQEENSFARRTMIGAPSERDRFPDFYHSRRNIDSIQKSTRKNNYSPTTDF